MSTENNMGRQEEILLEKHKMTTFWNVHVTCDEEINYVQLFIKIVILTKKTIKLKAEWQSASSFTKKIQASRVKISWPQS
jgi:hypothetical protein